MNLPKQTKRNTLFLTALVLFISWGVGYLFLEYQFKASVEDRFENLHESTKKLFKANIKHENHTFRLELENILSIDGLSGAVANRSHAELDELLANYYVNLKKEFPFIKILTFRSSDGITLYRAHKPNFYGDKLNKKRKLIVDTTRLQKSLDGFEVGKLDMTHRITYPIFHENIYVGNVEMGLNPVHFIKDLKTIFGMEMGIAIDKSLLSIMLDNKRIDIDDNYLFLKGNLKLKEYFLQNMKQGSCSLENDDSLKIKMSIPMQNHLHETLGYVIVGYDTAKIVQKDRDFMFQLFYLMAIMMLLLGVVLYQGFDRILKHFSHQVFTDNLTGLKNLASLNNKLYSKKSYSLILSNIKDFSLLNELYGLDVGNEVLVQVAKAFEEFAPKYGFDVFRISSDEYVLLKREDSFDPLKYSDIVDELHTIISSLEIWIDGLGDSIGVEIYSGIAFDRLHSLKDAQIALKIAKEKSLPYLAYTQKLDTKKQSENIIQVKRTIRYALEHKNVIPYFQPITDRDEKIIKYEALMRIVEFNDGKKNVLSPFHFLDIAMKSGLYIEMAKEVLRLSLLEFADRDEKIAINFLPKDFLNSHIMEAFLGHIKELKSPEKIVIEITEQEGIEDFDRLTKIIRMLKKLGVMIAIDDFGSGYSNYAHILSIKPDYLKIDGSLIKNILTNNESQILVKNIISFAKDLNIVTVAEYVENKEIFELLKEYGVDEYQGYYFSPAIDLINE